ncbi:MAG TPA: tetratricopeptide repeat protein [Candidatus Polarisedimenticolia bacterium]|jgi:tetratricopeptide (TPR) repeat protein
MMSRSPGILGMLLSAGLMSLGAPVAVRAAPATPDELFARADEALTAGRTEEAASLYGEALAADPRHWPSLCRLGEIDASARRYPEAERRLRAAVEINGDNGRCLSRLAQVLLVQDKTAEAEPYLARAAELMPADEGVLFNLARLYETTGRLDKALETYEKYLAAAPTSSRAGTAHLKVARMLNQARLPAEAIGHYEAFLRSQPDKNEVRAELAAALMASSKYPEALAEYDKVIAAGAADPAALANAGSICLLMQELPRAVELLEKSVAADKAPIPPRIGLATALAQSGEHARAVEVLRTVTADDPQNNRAWYLMGQSLMKLGKAREAREALERHRAIHERIMKERMTAEPQGHP